METFSDALLLSAVGLSVVFFVLAVIALVIAFIGRLDARWGEAEIAHKAAAVDKTPTLDHTTVVLISAAVATLLQGRGRIRRIRPLKPQDGASPWSQQARAHLQGSHIIRPKRDK
ncbi:OadG family protein [Myxococcota bacterium]|nr:OadG family protein [Myxococcota bacterium]